MVNIQSPTAEIKPGKKRKKKKKKQDENIMVCPITQGDHNKPTVKNPLNYRMLTSVIS